MRRIVLILALMAGVACGGNDDPAEAPSTSATSGTSSTSATSATSQTTTTTTRPAVTTTTRTAVSYANCDEVRAAGKAPLQRDDPGYSSKLDRDGDGVACDG